MSLRKLAGKDVLKRDGDKEVLLYYGIVAEKLQKYFSSRETQG